MGKGKQLNITVFLDLSDRIIKDHGYGPQWQKDTALVMHLVELFKKDAESRGTFCAKGCMRLRVEPPNAVMNSCISKTETDFSKFSQPGDRRALWSHMSESWSQCLSSAYGSAIQQGSKTEWPGSDLYGFMKDVDRYITPGYRNILVILTDGELYAENRRGEKDGNRTANLTSVQLRPYVKGNEAASIQSMKNAGLGLIDPRGAKAKLSDLEVIVLGMQPTHPNNPYIYSMLEYLWTDWFNRMGVQTDHLTLEKSSNSMDAKNALDNAIEAVR
ncbi:MAG: hypothetical protein JSS77_01390 [Acidobacteria bacterium]|nr:hypothetical protein [Acidobacteriota bacterium]